MAEVGEPVREPAWLTHQVDQRVAFMLDKVGGKFPAEAAGALITTPLTEPEPGSDHAAHERWDRSCDHCGTFVPIGENLWSGHVTRMVKVADHPDAPCIVTFGMCTTCKEAT